MVARKVARKVPFEWSVRTLSPTDTGLLKQQRDNVAAAGWRHATLQMNEQLELFIEISLMKHPGPPAGCFVSKLILLT